MAEVDEQAETPIPVVHIVIDEWTFIFKELKRQQDEINRIPEWLLADEYRIDDYGRRECSRGHLFVNALSKFCHICGEAR